MRAKTGIVVFSLLWLGACHGVRKPPSQAGIRRAIEAHLRQDPHLSLQNFTTEIVSVKLEGNTADALVRYRSKASPPVAVLVRYTLKKSGQGWEVTSSAPAGGQGMHGAGEEGANPPATTSPSGPPRPIASH